MDVEFSNERLRHLYASADVVLGDHWEVRTFDLSGYDCVSLLGLLYHLELADQLDLLARCAGTPTIIDTHVALEGDHNESGYAGKLFREIAGDEPDELAATATASWGNLYSFWPTDEELVRMILDSGFERVFKVVPPYLVGRTFYVCR